MLPGQLAEVDRRSVRLLAAGLVPPARPYRAVQAQLMDREGLVALQALHLCHMHVYVCVCVCETAQSGKRMLLRERLGIYAIASEFYGVQAGRGLSRAALVRLKLMDGCGVELGGRSIEFKIRGCLEFFGEVRC